jgi:CBS domain-containing protein
MTPSVATVTSDASVRQAAERMRELDVGFLPVSDTEERRLEGVVTDRDIVVRCIARGRNPDDCTVGEFISDTPLYCFADDDVDQAAGSMADQQVYRLIVLDDRDSKRLAGVISLGDLHREDRPDVAARVAQHIEGAA